MNEFVIDILFDKQAELVNDIEYLDPDLDKEDIEIMNEQLKELQQAINQLSNDSWCDKPKININSERILSRHARGKQ